MGFPRTADKHEIGCYKLLRQNERRFYAPTTSVLPLPSPARLCGGEACASARRAPRRSFAVSDVRGVFTREERDGAGHIAEPEHSTLAAQDI